MKHWNLADAKNRFSEVVNLALTKGPQLVRRRKDEVVVLSAQEFRHLKGQEETFKQYLLSGPTLEGLELKRDSSADREVDFKQFDS